MLWSKQLYNYDVTRWLDGDPTQPAPPPQRRGGRNSKWRNFDSFDLMSMPDKWKYPWFAAWDLAFHAARRRRRNPEGQGVTGGRRGGGGRGKEKTSDRRAAGSGKGGDHRDFDRLISTGGPRAAALFAGAATTRPPDVRGFNDTVAGPAATHQTGHGVPDGAAATAQSPPPATWSAAFPRRPSHDTIYRVPIPRSLLASTASVHRAGVT